MKSIIRLISYIQSGLYFVFTNFSLVISKHYREDDEECVEEIVRESISSNEDEREEAELKIRERSIDLEQSESQEEKDYKTEFFELLDEVSIPIRYPCVTYILTESNQTSID